jgi:hypothetical protein
MDYRIEQEPGERGTLPPDVIIIRPVDGRDG